MDELKKDDKVSQVRTVVADVARMIKNGELTEEQAQKIDPAVLEQAKVYSENIGESEFDLRKIAPEFMKNRDARLASEKQSQSDTSQTLTSDDGSVEILSQQQVPSEDLGGSNQPLQQKSESLKEQVLDVDDAPVHVIDIASDDLIDVTEKDKKEAVSSSDTIKANDDFIFGTKGKSTQAPINKAEETIIKTLDPDVAMVQNATPQENAPVIPVINNIDPVLEKLSVKEVDEKTDLENKKNEVEAKIAELSTQLETLVAGNESYINSKQDSLVEFDEVISDEKATEDKEREIEKEELKRPADKRALEQERWTLEDHRRELERKRADIHSRLVEIERQEVSRKKDEKSKRDSIEKEKKNLKQIVRRLDLLAAFAKTDELRKKLAQLKEEEMHAQSDKAQSETVLTEKQKNVAQKHKTEERMRKQLQDIGWQEVGAKTEEDRQRIEKERVSLEDNLRTFLQLEWNDEDAEKEALDVFEEKQRILMAIEDQIKDVEKELSQLGRTGL